MIGMLQAGTRGNRSLRVWLLAAAAIAAIGGLFGGLARLGWALPHGDALAALHGPLMISGLFGTLISLERSVALGRGWTYAAPGLAAASTILLLVGLPPMAGGAMFVAASAVLCMASLVVARQQPTLFNGILLLGALAWLAGNLLWLCGRPVPEVIGWWLAFPILTISGERLELSRMMAPKRGSEAAFLVAVALLLAGAQNALQTENGAWLFGLAMLAMTAWLLRFDIARRNIRQPGQTRFFAACMLSGYAWLGLAGLALILLPADTAGFRYDIAVHAVLIGFVLSMVFGHALIILPAVLRIRVDYRRVMYLPLYLLHAALAARILGGLFDLAAVRVWSGPAVILALVVFAASVAAHARHPGGRRTSKPLAGTAR